MIKEKKSDHKKTFKREKIIEAASALFSERNFHEVMMEDVAKLASFAKGTVYNYFSSKEELYFSIMKIRMEKLTTSLQGKIKKDMSAVESLHSFVIHLYMFMTKYQNFFLIYQKEAMRADNEFCSELRRQEEELKNILTEILRSGIKEGLFRKLEERFAVDLILGSIYGAIQRGIEKEISDELRADEREKVFDFILNGLFTHFQNVNKFPLLGRTLVVTRTIEQSLESVEVFKSLGAKIVVFPTLEIVPPLSWDEFDQIIGEPQYIDYIIFSSVHAVKMFSLRCLEINCSLDFARIKVVAVGNKTAKECSRQKLPVHILPNSFSAEGLVEELSRYDLSGKFIFIPRSVIGREELPEELSKLGAVIRTAAVYDVSTPPPEKTAKYIEELNSAKPDIFIYTSPSTFENFLEIMKIDDPRAYFESCTVAAIGPTTKSSIEKKNVRVDILPDEFTVEGLARKIVEYYSK